MSLLETPHYAVVRKTKLIELSGEYELHDRDGNALGSVLGVGHGAAHKTLRGLTGGDSFLNRRLEVRDAAGEVVAVVSRNRGWWCYVVTVQDAAGEVVGSVRIRLLAPSLPLPMGHALLDASGAEVGLVRSRGLRRRAFETYLGGQLVARTEQPWAGLVREAFTQADRFTHTRTAPVPEHLRALIFSVPLVVELAFKQGGGISPVGELFSVLDF